MTFEFQPCQPALWEGRYSRIPGDTAVFHVEYLNGRWWPTIKWDRDDGRGTCAALDSTAVRLLVNAVNMVKKRMSGMDGGSFLINEFGRVIVPSSRGDGTRMVVGTITGKLLFEDPFMDDAVIDLSHPSDMKCGDPLMIPYVGIPFNLSGRSKIYFYRIGSTGGGSVYPQAQDQDLIAALRKVRRSGPVKFIVNPYGLVATKQPKNVAWEPEEKWAPVFVGKVNFNKWFTKE